MQIVVISLLISTVGTVVSEVIIVENVKLLDALPIDVMKIR